MHPDKVYSFLCLLVSILGVSGNLKYSIETVFTELTLTNLLLFGLMGVLTAINFFKRDT